MKALLWKEYRELRPMLLVWLLALVALQALRQIKDFNDAFAAHYGGVFPLAAGLAAIALGSELLVRERQARTIDFLLTRPVGTGRIVWAKFLAGSASLFLFVGALSVISYPKVALIEFPFFWFAYSLAFLFSALVNRVQTVAASLFALSEIMVILRSVQMSGRLDRFAGAWCGLALLLAMLAGAVPLRRSGSRIAWVAIMAGAALVYLVIRQAAGGSSLPAR